MEYYDITEEEEDALDRDRVEPPCERCNESHVGPCDPVERVLWALALESAYTEDGEPRMDTRFDREAEYRHERGDW